MVNTSLDCHFTQGLVLNRRDDCRAQIFARHSVVMIAPIMSRLLRIPSDFFVLKFTIHSHRHHKKILSVKKTNINLFQGLLGQRNYFK